MAPAIGCELSGPEDFEQAVGDVGFRFIDFVDEDDDTLVFGPAGRLIGSGVWIDVESRLPMNSPPERSGSDVLCHSEFVSQQFAIWVEVAGDLGIRQSLNCIEGPEQIASFGGRIDGEVLDRTIEHRGCGVGELRFAKPRFTTYEQRSISGQCSFDGPILIVIHQVIDTFEIIFGDGDKSSWLRHVRLC